MKTEAIAPEEPQKMQKIEPCEHMTDYVSSMSDGSLRGPVYWYTRLHLLHCKKCGPALRQFTDLRTHLSALRDAPLTLAQLKPETRTALQQAMDVMDAQEEQPA